jgi:hypothetical protein
MSGYKEGVNKRNQMRDKLLNLIVEATEDVPFTDIVGALEEAKLTLIAVRMKDFAKMGEEEE